MYDFVLLRRIYGATSALLRVRSGEFHMDYKNLEEEAWVLWRDIMMIARFNREELEYLAERQWLDRGITAIALMFVVVIVKVIIWG
jgi:hypothetical protein